QLGSSLLPSDVSWRRTRPPSARSATRMWYRPRSIAPWNATRSPRGDQSGDVKYPPPPYAYGESVSASPPSAGMSITCGTGSPKRFVLKAIQRPSGENVGEKSYHGPPDRYARQQFRATLPSTENASVVPSGLYAGVT